MRKLIPLLIMVILMLSGLGSAELINKDSLAHKEEIGTNDGTEYWALLVGCNEFDNDPGSILPGNDLTANDLRYLLLSSDNWQSDHIRVLTGSEASTRNIIKGLKWLDAMDDEDDICLFFINTHGSYIDDLPPKDEKDGLDEALMTYSTHSWELKPGVYFCLPYIHFIIDDQLHYYLNKLDARGVCAIFHTCYSGGFIDPPVHDLRHVHDAKDFQFRWDETFGEEFSESGRIIITSSSEDGETNGNWFTYYFMEALQGFGNIGEDTMVSAEEAFEYAAPRTSALLLDEYSFPQEPQIYDDFSGDLLLTSSELPPVPARLDEGSLIGTVNTENIFILSSTDPEGDRIRYYFNWDDGSEEWTEFVESGEAIPVGHVWEKPGTYNVYMRTEDEQGMSLYEGGVPRKKMVVSIYDEDMADQRMTDIHECLNYPEGVCNNRIWLAQEFIPSFHIVSKVDLHVFSLDTDQSIRISICDTLPGEDLTEITVDCPTPPLILDPLVGIKWMTWATFDFPDVEVIPGKPYYIICQCDRGGNKGGVWLYSKSQFNDSYTNGKAYISKNSGESWIIDTGLNDFCFVTYGR